MTFQDADWPASSHNGKARAAAFAAHQPAPVDAPVLSLGAEARVLIIGPGAFALEQADALAGQFEVTVVATDTSGKAGSTPLHRAVPVALEGSLGGYELSVAGPGGGVPFVPVAGRPSAFDLVLDLGREPLIRSELTPPGYFSVAGDAERLHHALEQLPEMVGSFEKPVYLAYQADICAHGERGVAGCTRCIDNCPSGALISVAERIVVDDGRCHGVGSCVAECPTGALAYLLPRVDAELDALRRLLRAYREANGETPLLCLHDEDQGAAWLAAHANELPECLLPWPMENPARAGLAAWLAQLALGAASVVVLLGPDLPATTRASVANQRRYVQAVLAGFNIAPETVRLVDLPADAGDTDFAVPPAASWRAAGFTAAGEQRTWLRHALDHFWQQSDAPHEQSPLPAGAPFGEVRVDARACTLCMSCVAVCPTRALSAGDGTPRLDFTEWQCVQCGLCDSACPEDAITLVPRMLNNPDTRRTARLLHEEAPFECIRCGKPFATLSTITRMEDKLAGHPMFREQRALDRLRMCEDCRVKDMFADPSASRRPM